MLKKASGLILIRSVQVVSLLLTYIVTSLIQPSSDGDIAYATVLQHGSHHLRFLLINVINTNLVSSWVVCTLHFFYVVSLTSKKIKNLYELNDGDGRSSSYIPK